MKKILMFCCFGVLYSGIAFGSCDLLPGRGTLVKGNEALNIDGGHYVCGEGMCADGEVVGVWGTAEIGRKKQSAKQLYRCNMGRDDKWEVVGSIKDCTSYTLGAVAHSHKVMSNGQESMVNACLKNVCDDGYTEKYDGDSRKCYENDSVCSGGTTENGRCKWLNDSHASECKRECSRYGLWDEKITKCLGTTEPSTDGKSCVEKDDSKLCSATFGGMLLEGSILDTRPIACSMLEVYESSSIDGYESGGFGWEYARTCEIWCQNNGKWRGRVVSCDETRAEMVGGACKQKTQDDGSNKGGINITISNDGSATVANSGNSQNTNDNQHGDRTTVNGDRNNVGNSNTGSNNTGDRSNVGNSNNGDNNIGDGSIFGSFNNGSKVSGDDDVIDEAENTQPQIDCENSGGKWKDSKCVCSADLIDANPGKTCKCKDKNAKWDVTKRMCIVTTPAPSCRSSRHTPKGQACCDTPYANNWNEKTQTCTCGANERFEVYNTNRGRCVKVEGKGGQSGGNDGDPDAPVVELYKCSLDMFANWRSLYRECTGVIAALDELELYCVSSERDENGYMTRYTRLTQLRRVCEDEVAEKQKQREEDAKKQRITKSTAIIGDASQKLDDIMAGLKISVWKTAEGKFNTARLASDSIAGVVLGTAGGLITSHVVKKNQVKKGFEDIQCTVGGQNVADWGDEFTVGIR